MPDFGINKEKDLIEIAENTIDIIYAIDDIYKHNTISDKTNYDGLYSIDEIKNTDPLVEALPKCTTPVISYTQSNTITMSCTTRESVIFYRQGNSGNWIQYNGTFSFGSTSIYQAYAIARGYAPSNTAEVNCIYTPYCATPSISLSTTSNTVTITCSTPNSTIYYRRGSSGNFTQYTGSFSISSSTTVYAYATAPGYNNSSTTSRYCSYTPRCATPVISKSGNTISITCSTSNSTIYYRIGSSGSYSRYTGSFTISSTVTIYAYATAPGYNTSNTASGTYTANTVSTPRITQTSRSNLITISCSTSNSTIYYRIRPDSTGTYGSYTRYTGSFRVTENCRIQAYATRSGYVTSSTRSYDATYKIEFLSKSLAHRLSLSEGEPVIYTSLSVSNPSEEIDQDLMAQLPQAIPCTWTFNGSSQQITLGGSIICGAWTHSLSIEESELDTYVGKRFTVSVSMDETDDFWGINLTTSGTYTMPQLDTPTITVEETDDGMLDVYINKNSSFSNYPDDTHFRVNISYLGFGSGGIVSIPKEGETIADSINIVKNKGKVIFASGTVPSDKKSTTTAIALSGSSHNYLDSNEARVVWTPPSEEIDFELSGRQGNATLYLDVTLPDNPSNYTVTMDSTQGEFTSKSTSENTITFKKEYGVLQWAFIDGSTVTYTVVVRRSGYKTTTKTLDYLV